MRLGGLAHIYRVSGLEVYKNTCAEMACVKEKIRDLADLRQRIIEAIEFITPHLLINTWQELEHRLDICRATKGAHIEVYGSA